MQYGTCKLCGEHRALIQAHILPRGVYFTERGEPGIVIPGDTRLHISKNAGGFYDPGILCERCDNEQLGPFDKFGTHLLRDKEWDAYLTGSGDNAFYRVAEVDYFQLKFFLLVCLWRSAITTRPEFKHVRLGPMIHELDRLVKTRDAVGPDVFSVIATRLRVEPGSPLGIDPSLGLYLPASHRQLGLRVVKIQLWEFVFSVKTDSRPWPSDYADFVLQPGRDWLVFHRDFWTSSHARTMIEDTALQDLADVRRRGKRVGRAR